MHNMFICIFISNIFGFAFAMFYETLYLFVWLVGFIFPTFLSPQFSVFHDMDYMLIFLKASKCI